MPPRVSALVLVTACSVAACAGGPAPKPDQPPEPAARDDAPRHGVTVEVTDPCVYTGLLRTDATIYAGADGDGVIGAIRGPFTHSEVTVEATVWPPATREDRARIAVHTPFEIEGWLDASDRPLAARVRLDVVPGHIWLDPHFEVHAFGVEGETIEVAEPLAPNQNLEVEPGGVFRRVPCESLALSTMGGFVGPTASEGDPFVRLDDGPVELLDAPGGDVIGRVVDGGQFQRLEQRDGYVRITESEPVHVDVWVAAEHTSPVDDEPRVPGGVVGGVPGGVVGGVPGGIPAEGEDGDGEEADDHDDDDDDDDANDR